jgi:Tfp pilus assembly protein PilN
MPQYLRGVEGHYETAIPPVGWSWRLLTFSALVCGSTLMLYVGMAFGYGSFLNNKINTLQTQLDDLNRQVKPEDQIKLFEFYSRAFNIQQILKNRVSFSDLMTLVDQNTNTHITVTSMKFDQVTNVLDIFGTAPSYNEVVQQLEAFRRVPATKTVDLLSSKANEAQNVQERSKVDFQIRILLNEAKP